MRYATLLCSAVLLVGCADAAEDENDAADMPADTAPAGLSLADVAGTWAMSVRPQGSDSVVTTFHLFANGDPADWKLKFDNREDTIAVHTVEVAGDSITMEFGPYSSAVRPGVTVTTRGAYRLEGDRMVGVSVARYDVTTADSVVTFEIEGTRAP